ncbi:MAG: peptidoglycan-associated lipoprotein Pal [Nitrospirae bacterium]|nr:peptidoglycan-associated lipoprotein Pal [Nitrospirota bacterium]
MKKLSFLILIILCGTFIFAGCGKKAATKGPEQQTDVKPVEKESLSDKSKAQEQQSPKRTEPDTIVETQRQKAQMSDSKTAMSELQSRLKDVYFDFDRYDIRDDAKPVLKDASAGLVKNRGIKIIIEGHCDERGTNEYNLGLGDKRANAVKNFLLSLGIPSSKIETVSYGEEKPVCSEAAEECWARNRRAHFVLTEDKK